MRKLAFLVEKAHGDPRVSDEVGASRMARRVCPADGRVRPADGRAPCSILDTHVDDRGVQRAFCIGSKRQW